MINPFDKNGLAVGRTTPRGAVPSPLIAGPAEYANPHRIISSKQLGVSIIDANILMDILSGQFNNEYPESERRTPCFQLNQLFDILTHNPQHTMMMPREVFNETMALAAGYADIMQDPQTGAFDVNTYNAPHQYMHHTSLRLAEKINALRDEGLLRVYGSVNEMLKAGETSSPKGGLVIVNTNITPALQADINPHGLKRINGWGNYDNDGIEREESAIGMGDRAIVSLATTIIKHNIAQGEPHLLSVLSSDAELKNKIRKSTFNGGSSLRNKAYTSDLVELLYGMASAGLIPMQDANNTVTDYAIMRRTATERRLAKDPTYKRWVSENHEFGSIEDFMKSPQYIGRLTGKTNLFARWWNDISTPLDLRRMADEQMAQSRHESNTLADSPFPPADRFLNSGRS